MLEDRDYMRQPEYRDPMFHGFRWSWTMVLFVANLVVFILTEVFKAYRPQMFLDLYEYCALSRAGLMHGYVWQYVTFQFLHMGIGHFAGNMIGLFIFGRPVEERIAGKRFILFYLACGVFGGLLQSILGLIFPGPFGGMVVGASAGVFGLLAAFAAFEPEAELLVFFVLPVKIKYLALFGAVVALFYTVVPAQPGLAHAAHLGGMAAGWFYVQKIWKGDGFKLPGTLRRAGKSEPRRPKPEPLEPKGDTDFVESQVDPILDKISAHGIASLTTREREILEAARRKMGRP